MLFVRLLFRFSVKGHLNLPASGPFIITPNHSSPLDLPILAAALPLGLQRQAYWTGKESTVLRTWLRRTLSWCTRIVPIAEDVTAIAPAVKILERGDKLIWAAVFYRGTRGALTFLLPAVPPVEAIDPQMVADIVLSHDPTSAIVKGKLGIKSVTYTEHIDDAGDAKARLIKALKDLLNELDE